MGALGAGLQFKGDGFYLTDYVRKKDNGAGEKKAKAGASTEASAPKGSSSKASESTATPSTTASDG